MSTSRPRTLSISGADIVLGLLGLREDLASRSSSRKSTTNAGLAWGGILFQQELLPRFAPDRACAIEATLEAYLWITDEPVMGGYRRSS
jgi:hypothetical protein